MRHGSVTKTKIAVMQVMLFLAINSYGYNQKLSEGWSLQSSSQITESGSEISAADYNDASWYDINVPATVLAGLAENQVYTDIYYGRNLEQVNTGDFDASWWYRREFEIPQQEEGKRVHVYFAGINFSANIWLNGSLVASKDEVFGTFRTFEFDVTDHVNYGGINTLAVETFRPSETDLAFNYVDWAPDPPDGNMGIYREVVLKTSGPVTVRSPHVVTDVDIPDLDAAHLTVTADLENRSSSQVSGTLQGNIGDISFSRDITLDAGESRTEVFSHEDITGLNIYGPNIWWPNNYGEQPLYDLSVTFTENEIISDSTGTKFGIREISSYLSNDGHRVFQVNGKNIFIKGAGWCPDLLQRFSPGLQEAHIKYVKDMGLNCIRQEGKFEDQHFYDLCDKYGILVIAGWCCCDKWERWNEWVSDDYTNAYQSTRSKIKELRTHPSSLTWMNGSDFPPPADVEQTYLDILDELRWPNPVVSNATATGTSVSGESGVKMTGPYEWVPPIYWETMQHVGGASGFATEHGPGPSPVPMESLQEMMPADHHWPIDDQWNYHCGTGIFDNLNVFTEALNNRFGTASDAADYADKAQILAYESHRAMFEAYRRHKYYSTGIIQWMLNNAWPSMIWHLYDYYMRPGGSYFGAKTSCKPLHIQYSYDDRMVVAVNGTLESYQQMRGYADVYNLDGTLIYENDAVFSIQEDGVEELFAVPDLPQAQTTHLLRLTLRNSAGEISDINTYWLSTTDDVLNTGATNWYYTPTSSFADMTGLQNLAEVTVACESSQQDEGADKIITSNLVNNGDVPAFGIHMKVTKGENGEEALPVIWEDNYMVLLPGEEREITCRFESTAPGGEPPYVELSGWNVATVSDNPVGIRPVKKPGLSHSDNKFRVSVYNLKGRLVFRTITNSIDNFTTGNLKQKIGLPADRIKSSGVYFYHVKPVNGNNKEFVRRVMHLGR